MNKHGAFSIPRQALRSRSSDQSCHHETWLHLQFVEWSTQWKHQAHYNGKFRLKEWPATSGRRAPERNIRGVCVLVRLKNWCVARARGVQRIAAPVLPSFVGLSNERFGAVRAAHRRLFSRVEQSFANRGRVEAHQLFGPACTVPFLVSRRDMQVLLVVEHSYVNQPTSLQRDRTTTQRATAQQELGALPTGILDGCWTGGSWSTPALHRACTRSSRKARRMERMDELTHRILAEPEFSTTKHVHQHTQPVNVARSHN